MGKRVTQGRAHKEKRKKVITKASEFVIGGNSSGGTR